MFQFPPSLAGRQIARGRIVPNLEQSLEAIPEGSTVVQVGVRLGDVTGLLLQQPAVAKLLVMDHFDLHQRQNDSAVEELGGKDQHTYIREKFADAISSRRLETHQGRLETIKALPPDSVAAFFIRGGRDFAPLMDEFYMCDAKLQANGLIWVADYIMANYLTGERYEVVNAVNEFVQKTCYELVYFVLEHTMFCNVVWRKPS